MNLNFDMMNFTLTNVECIKTRGVLFSRVGWMDLLESIPTQDCVIFSIQDTERYRSIKPYFVLTMHNFDVAAAPG